MGAKAGKIVALEDVQTRAPDEYKRLFKVWARLSRDGVMNRECFHRDVLERYSAEFPVALGKRFFEAFDANGNGLLDGEEFVTGMFVLLRGTNTERMHLAFRIYDSGSGSAGGSGYGQSGGGGGGSGTITLRDICNTMQSVTAVSNNQLDALADTLREQTGANHGMNDAITPAVFVRVASLSAHAWLWTWLLYLVPEAAKTRLPSAAAASAAAHVVAPLAPGGGAEWGDPSAEWLHSRKPLAANTAFSEAEVAGIERLYRRIAHAAAQQAAAAATASSSAAASSSSSSSAAAAASAPLPLINPDAGNTNRHVTPAVLAKWLAPTAVGSSSSASTGVGVGGGQQPQPQSAQHPVLCHAVLVRLCSALDSNGDGCVEAHELVRELSRACGRHGATQQLEFAFRVFDADRDGVLSRAELQAMAVWLHDSGCTLSSLPPPPPNDGKLSFAQRCDAVQIGGDSGPLASAAAFGARFASDKGMLAFAAAVDAHLCVRLGVRPSSATAERRLIRALLSAAAACVSAGQEYYVISMRWFSAWKTTVEWDPPGSAAAAATAAAAAALINGPLPSTPTGASTPSSRSSGSGSGSSSNAAAGGAAVAGSGDRASARSAAALDFKHARAPSAGHSRTDSTGSTASSGHQPAAAAAQSPVGGGGNGSTTSTSSSGSSTAQQPRPLTAPAKSKNPYSPSSTLSPKQAAVASVLAALAATSRPRPSPPPIDNSDLLDKSAEPTTGGMLGALTTVALRRGLTLGRECLAIPEPVWTALWNWYGGGPVLARYIVPSPPVVSPPGAVKPAVAPNAPPPFTADLYPFALTLVLTHLKERRVSFLYSRICRVRELHTRVCEALRLNPAHVRLWVRPTYESGGGRVRLLVGPPVAAAPPAAAAPVPVAAASSSTLHANGAVVHSAVGAAAAPAPAPATPKFSAAQLAAHTDALTLAEAHMTDRTELLLELRCSDGSWRMHTRPPPKEPVDAAEFDAAQAAAAGGSVPDLSLVPVDARGLIRRRTGLVGLENLGNTCFLNSAMQAVSHTTPLTDYFLSDLYMAELVVETPTAKLGAVAVELATLLKVMWSTRALTCISPKQFKWMLGRFHSTFSGYAQQDAEELLRFVFSELHDSLNRSAPAKRAEEEAKAAAKREGRKWVDPRAKHEAVTKKLSVSEQAAAHWAHELELNRSVIMDIFYFSVKSTLCCQAVRRSAPPSRAATPPMGAAPATAVAAAVGHGPVSAVVSANGTGRSTPAPMETSPTPPPQQQPQPPVAANGDVSVSEAPAIPMAMATGSDSAANSRRGSVDRAALLPTATASSSSSQQPQHPAAPKAVASAAVAAAVARMEDDAPAAAPALAPASAAAPAGAPRTAASSVASTVTSSAARSAPGSATASPMSGSPAATVVATAPADTEPCGWQSSQFQPYSTLPLNLPPPTPVAAPAGGAAAAAAAASLLSAAGTASFLYEVVLVRYPRAPALQLAVTASESPQALRAQPSPVVVSGAPSPTAAAGAASAGAAAAAVPAAAALPPSTAASPLAASAVAAAAADPAAAAAQAAAAATAAVLRQRDPYGRHHVRYAVRIGKHTTVLDLIQDVSAASGVAPQRLLLADVYGSYVYSLLTDTDALVLSFAHNTRVYAYELPTPPECIPPAVLAPPSAAEIAAAQAAGLPPPKPLVSIPIYVKFICRQLVRSGFGADNDRYFTVNNHSVKLFAVPFVLLLPSLIGWEPLYDAVWKHLQHMVAPSYRYEPGHSRPFKLRMTNRSGTACRRCVWTRGCLGCDLNPKEMDHHAILELREIGCVAVDFERQWLLEHYDPVAAHAVCEGVPVPPPANGNAAGTVEPTPAAAAAAAAANGNGTGSSGSGGVDMETSSTTSSHGSTHTTSSSADVKAPPPGPTLAAASITLHACLDEFIKAERLTAKCERCSGTENKQQNAVSAASTPQASPGTAPTPVAVAAPPGAGGAAPAAPAAAAAKPPPVPQQPFTKQLSLWTCPRVLIIQLKRFEYDGSKNDARVDFPISGLDLSPYMAARPGGAGASSVYDLYAVVNHFGSTGAGHYMACVRTGRHPVTGAGGVWHTFDDHSVRELDEQALREPAAQGAAYLLFYQRREPAVVDPVAGPAAGAGAGAASPAPAPAAPGTAPWLEQLTRGWALTDAERRTLVRYPGSQAHAKKKAHLKALQDSGACVIL